MSEPCFHCGEPIPKGISLFVTIDQQAQAMCCAGCQAVAETIVDNKLTDYYKFRTENAPKGTALVPEQLKRNQLLDDDNLQHEFTHQSGDTRETILTVDGISCAACAWLIEMKLEQIPGVSQISVNATTQRASVHWQNKAIKLSKIIEHIERLGYHALPFKASDAEQQNLAQSKTFIKRLGISGILMMQVMMIAVGLYFGAFSDMSEHNLVYLRYTSLLLTTPIIFYGALPFYIGALSALKSRRLSMDVPVSIAILLAFFASAWATISQQGEVYFESVSMFTFLLLIGKFLEFRARSRAAQVSANLLKLMPMTATKLVNNIEQYVAAKSLQINDTVMIKPGETVPADCIVAHGESHLNEAMLSGEQRPVAKQLGDSLFAGTINGDGNLTARVTQPGSDTFLSQLIRLSESSQAHKPKIAQLSDKIAQYFVGIILLTAIGTALYWYQHMPSEAFWITLSVLVATCPCALSLATPTALTCGTTRLNRDGIMIKSGHVMETVPEVDTFAFDKTGTLTQGEFQVTQVKRFNDNHSEQQILTLVAALEAHSQHPLAKAFVPFRDFQINAVDTKVHAGLGISGTVDGNAMTVGKVSWLMTDAQQVKTLGCEDAQIAVFINDHPVAAIYLKDSAREDASQVLTKLKASNIGTLMLSGDSMAGCQQIASQLPIDEVHASLSAHEKMAIVNRLQHDKTVAMVGDGVNDTPVFSAAHVSVAMGSGTDVAKSGADVILLNNKLSSLNVLQTVAQKTKRIIWQNYGWAFGYNAIVLPLAVCGFITPYMAVIGMSASSILVITNSLRLLKK
ncbi:cadmium-translocating P-type ATPase [Thalassotalea euphylliae]|uniref:P-type Cu(2+) transporter n=1 Tax=Thalassotalea euphylliae TaxID=1655234 RepID=A0A3E0TRA0_9GAMM|nr:heavy metal translocating P-type ATPase [Thalassotalea euphylliae]REL27136.1 cadmium-translocating P-type ATPase [Thalassotalea euphylliae]